MMKVLIYGECDQYGSGAWCYFDTLKAMGHTVSFFSPQTSLEVYKKSFPLKVFRKIKNGGIFEKHRKNHLQKLRIAVAETAPQIIIVLKGLHLDRKLVEELKTNAWVVLINHDDFFSRYKSSRSKIQFSAIPAYDYIFATKEINAAEIKSLNANIEFFPFAYHPGIHFQPDYNEQDKLEWETDIVFIGSCYPERKRQLEFLVGHLQQPFVLKIYGSGWNSISPGLVLSGYVQNKFLNPEEMRTAIYYSKVALGFLCKENRDDYTQRTFEIPACGGLLLAERTARHLNYFEEGKEAVFFDSNNYDEMLAKVNALICNSQENERIRSNGFKKVISSGNTYKNRLEKVLNLYASAKNDLRR
jgi:hypothetical protein